MDSSVERVSGAKENINGDGNNLQLVPYFDNKMMDPSEESVSRGNNNHGSVNHLQLVPYSDDENTDPSEERVSEGYLNGGGGKNMQLVPYSNNSVMVTGQGRNNGQLVPYSHNNNVVPTKKVCRYCNREFKCGRSLGGHIRIHTMVRKRSRLTRRKMNNSRKASPPPSPEPLPMLRWTVKKKRSTSVVIVAAPADSSSDDDHIECHEDDSCDEDDYANIRLRRRLRRHGFTNTGHKISWAKRIMICKVCNQEFKTIVNVYHHVKEKPPTYDSENEGEKGKRLAGEGPSTQVASNEVDSGELKDRSGDGGGAFGIKSLDLNKMPPAED
ncbi:hypothetical protein Fmac_026666 [Flemingia macrophylla]|uniref:C2H2-type domain-containing protein n=1 Tax=Flemingia macrophylla TaxID=520843 RepID=A0ABD1LFH2_9FABA